MQSCRSRVKEVGRAKLQDALRLARDSSVRVRFHPGRSREQDVSPPNFDVVQPTVHVNSMAEIGFGFKRGATFGQYCFNITIYSVCEKCTSTKQLPETACWTCWFVLGRCSAYWESECVTESASGFRTCHRLRELEFCFMKDVYPN